MFLPMQAHELTVYASHGIASGQAEREQHLPANRVRNEMGGVAANLFLIALQYHQHVRAFRSLCCKSSPQLQRDKRESATARSYRKRRITRL